MYILLSVSWSYYHVFSAMSWIKKEPLDEIEYKFYPDLNQDLSQDIDNRHRNDHLDIINSMKKEHSDDNGHRNDHLDFRRHSEVHFEKNCILTTFLGGFVLWEILCVCSFNTSVTHYYWFWLLSWSRCKKKKMISVAVYKLPDIALWLSPSLVDHRSKVGKWRIVMMQTPETLLQKIIQANVLEFLWNFYR